MNVKCPSCQSEYDLEPGKYECECGTEFIVENVLETEAAPPLTETPPETAAEKCRCGLVRKVVKPALVIIAVLAAAGIGCGIYQYIEERRDADPKEFEKRIAEAKAQGVRFSEDHKTLLWGPPKITGTYKIPYGVTRIEERAFEGRHLTRVVIPKSVKSIGDRAFWGCEKLTGINIPDSVTDIGYAAFDQCQSLKSIKLPAGITAIKNGTFRHCRNLTSIRIPAGVTSIGKWAFEGCIELTGINIPEGVATIGAEVFGRCQKLSKIKIPASVASIGAQSLFAARTVKVDGKNKNFANGPVGEVIDLNKKRLLFFPRNFSGSYNVADGIKSLDPFLFFECQELTVNIPESVAVVGRNALTGVKAVKVSGKNKNFTNGSAREVMDLNKKSLIFFPQDFSGSYNIPYGVTKIEDSTFFNCQHLTGINIPDSVKYIGNLAFAGCKKLASVNIPDGVTYIGDCAFSNCRSLTRINIPDSVKSIGAGAFGGTQINSITLPAHFRGKRLHLFNRDVRVDYR